MPGTAYCTTDDLLLGNLPVGTTVDPAKYVQDAAEEIDSKIGRIYQTPLILGNLSRPSLLLIQRINKFLATGRILLTLDLPNEESRMHAVAKQYITDASSALAQIVNGDVRLDGAVLINADFSKNAGPLAINNDGGSMVDGFYTFTTPDPFYRDNVSRFPARWYG